MGFRWGEGTFRLSPRLGATAQSILGRMTSETARMSRREALAALAPWGEGAEALRALARLVVTRRK